MSPRHLIHLHNRMGFGLAPDEFRARRGATRGELVDALLAVPADRDLPLPGGHPEPMSDEARATDRVVLDGMRADWMRRMADADAPDGLERMCLFWHGHFACRSVRAREAARYLNTLRRHGLGNFRTLLHELARDAAVVRFLNAQHIRRAAPNENFAREMLELFTVGVDGYAEGDVRDLARAFAGWARDDEGEFTLSPEQLDGGRKSILGKSGAFTGAEALDLLVDSPLTARYLTRELWRYLTDREPDAATVARHADTLLTGDYAIAPWVRGILTDDAFYADELIGARVKSPVDLLATWARQLGTPLPRGEDAFVTFAKANGQQLLLPPDVSGWPGGLTWLSSATLPARMAMARVSVGHGGDIVTREDRSFRGVLGFAAGAAKRSAGDPDLSRVLLNRPGVDAAAVQLGSHSLYQYA